MASHWRLQNPLHSGLLLQRANEMRKVRMLCDTLITVGDQEFHAHSLVLACSSRKFQALFQGQGKHCTIDFLSGRTFQQILEFSYSEALEVSPGDLRGLLAAAEVLEMETLVQECIKMLGRLSPQRHNDNEESPGSTRRDSRLEMELASKKTLKSSVIAGSAQNMVPGFESSGHTLNISENMNTSLTASNDLQGFPFYVPEMRQYPQAIGHCDSKDMIPNRLVSLQRKATPRDPETRGSPSSRNQSYPMIAGARKTSISTFGAMKPRESITITTPHLIPSVVDEARSWSADVQWGSRDAMVTIQSSPSLQPNTAYWSYPLSTPLLPPFSMVNTGGTVLSPVMGIPGYLDSFPQGLFDSQFIHKQTIVDLAQASKYKGQCNGASSPMNMVSPEEKKLASPIRGYQCEICEKNFMDGLCLRMHLLSHTGYQPQPCIQCEAFLSRSEGLGAHSKTPTDGEVSSTSTYSPSCSSPSSMLCLLCGKRYNAQISLKKQASLLTGACSCRCSECRRAFSSQTTLRRHLRTHKGENRYECEFCYRYFRDERTLRNHKRTHTGEKVYKCHSCSKKFSLKHQLETHLRVHTGEKPFECHLCHQRSRDYSAMIKHLRTHSGAAPYRCTICLQFCSSLSAMQKHMRGHEAEEIPADWSIEKTYLYSCNT